MVKTIFQNFHKPTTCRALIKTHSEIFYKPLKRSAAVKTAYLMRWATVKIDVLRASYAFEEGTNGLPKLVEVILALPGPRNGLSNLLRASYALAGRKKRALQTSASLQHVRWW